MYGDATTFTSETPSALIVLSRLDQKTSQNHPTGKVAIGDVFSGDERGPVVYLRDCSLSVVRVVNVVYEEGAADGGAVCCYNSIS